MIENNDSGRKNNLIMDLTYQFALSIIDYTDLLESKKKYNMANQLFRSGTSIGANVRETQSAESIKDFIHKFKIAHKETLETKYWLELCQESIKYPSSQELLIAVNNIDNIIAKIILSNMKKLSGNNNSKFLIY